MVAAYDGDDNKLFRSRSEMEEVERAASKASLKKENIIDYSEVKGLISSCFLCEPIILDISRRISWSKS